MQEVKERISKELYDAYKSIPESEFNKKIKENIPIYWECGYGWYGCRLLEERDEHYIVHTIGDTCD